ncbi:hypothetical protein B0H66DRAFT_536287 [Apodospora peruviana]|uniref:Uncharacterized protein n=1 Tax=Apodospora peruviana TaxID=516989 RepID=A0AAE0HYR9_9PEZI|nr:hypothetical protein B0H66DRAFT_536287 [Apodospora peruviana]
MPGIWSQILLGDFCPRTGFLWRRNHGPEDILRSDARDEVVERALIHITRGKKGSTRLLCCDVVRVVGGALERVALAIESGKMEGSLDIQDFLEGAAALSQFSRKIGTDIWIELVYQVTWARYLYERQTSAAVKTVVIERGELSRLAHAADRLMDAAGSRWDWFLLTVHAYPHLIGGSSDDYNPDDEDDGDNEEGEEASGVDTFELVLPSLREA